MSIIFFSEKNVRGGWAVYGLNGVKQYYGYTKKEAEKMYTDQYRKETFVNMPVKKD